MKLCPGCRSAGTREVAVGKRVRVECSGCGRFAGWADAIPTPSPGIATAPKPAVPAEPIPEKSPGSPQAWLYVSRRLDLDWVPNDPLWRVPAYTRGSTDHPVAFFRLTARVLVWLEKCGEQLEARMLAGEVPRAAVDEFVEHMRPVWEFAGRHVPVGAVRLARESPASLPDPPVPV